MCQLTLLATNFNNNILPILLSANSIKMNHDGWGVFTPTGLVKSKNHFILEPEIKLSGLFPKDDVFGEGEKFIAAHVREASKVNKAKIDDRFSHPFESKDFIFAHNGTLSLEKEFWKKEFDSMIDSEIFLTIFQEEYDKEKGCDQDKKIVNALNNSMALFDGKFAFIFCEKSSRKFYVVRGLTAELHIAEIKFPSGNHLGYIVNTEKDTLLIALSSIQKMFAITSGWGFNFEIKEVKKESIFLAEEQGLKLIGELKQNFAQVSDQTQKWDNWRNWGSRLNIDDDDNGVVVYGPKFNSEPIDDFITNRVRDEEIISALVDEFYLKGLGLEEIDILSYLMFDKNFIFLTKPQIEEILDKFKEFKVSKLERKLWRKIGKIIPPMDAYIRYGLVFPYFINTPTALKNVYAKLREIVTVEENDDNFDD